MRISFVGKGGSGKTTISSLFIRHLQDTNKPTLAIDADINQHLCDAIGIQTRSQKALGLHQSELKTLFAGTNPLIDPTEMIKTTPPGKGSFVARGIQELMGALDDFAHTEHELHVIQVGTQTQDDVGIRCYHSKTGAVEMLLNHLVENENEYIVIDMTAGADAFASGLFDKFDLTIVVVEPTQKSVSVYLQYAEQAKPLGVHVRAVGNKVINEEDKVFLRKALGNDLIGCMHVSPFIRSQERGEIKPFSELEPENRALMESIEQTLAGREKNWQQYMERTIDVHRKNAKSWGNDSIGIDLETQIDPTFQYAD